MPSFCDNQIFNSQAEFSNHEHNLACKPITFSTFSRASILCYDGQFKTFFTVTVPNVKENVTVTIIKHEKLEFVMRSLLQLRDLS